MYVILFKGVLSQMYNDLMDSIGFVTGYDKEVGEAMAQ